MTSGTITLPESGGGLTKYADAASLPLTADEGDAAVTVDTGNIWTYTGGVWVQQSSGSTTVTLNANTSALGLTLSGQEINASGSIVIPASGTITLPTAVSPNPTIKFDSDTGWGSDGDGAQYWSCNNQEILRLTTAGLDVIVGDLDVTNGDLSVSGNISAANFPPTGNNNAVAGFDGTGDLYSIPSLSIDTTSGGIFQSLTEEPDGNTGGFQVNNSAVSFDPQQNSPDETWNLVNNQMYFDINSSGFTQGTGGQAATLLSQGYTHNGTGDVGGLNGIQQNFALGNGTDPIDVKGFGYVFGFGNISANVNISGQIQGYGFQPSANASATLGSSAQVNAFYDYGNFPVAVPGYTSYTSGPNIGSIANNSNHVSYNANPTIGTLTGNAGYFGFACSPTITTVNTGSTRCVNYNPTITLNKGNAVGIDVNMGNVTNYAGVQSTLVIQDITYTFIAAGDNNNVQIEYVNDGTAGAETFTIAFPLITCHMQSGVSTATQIQAAAVTGLAGNITAVVTGTGSNTQVSAAAANFSGGINPGTSKAANFVGDVDIQGDLSFTGSLALGALNSFATSTITSGAGVTSVDTLITQPVVPASATITGTDLLGVNTAMLLTIGAGASVASSFLGYAALGLPAVLTMGAGSTIDLVEGAVFALSLDGGAGGGTAADVRLCRALAIPNGITTITKLKGYAFDLPFGDPGTTTWGLYIEDAPQSWLEGGLKIGGTAGSTDTTAEKLEVEGSTFLNGQLSHDGGDVGFFGVTPVSQPTSAGAATAGAVYTATEQAMLQQVYDAARALGLMS